MLELYLNLIDTEDKSKTEELYYTYKKLMLKVAYDILGNYELANDALHEAFLRILRNIKKLIRLTVTKRGLL